MLGSRILLLNPPLVDGVAYSRQGRCQEREEMLGTTKPPYTLALIAALLRQKGHSLRLVDLTAEQRTSEDLIDDLRREGFTPTLVVFASCYPTFDPDVREAVKLKRAFGAPIISFGPHASSAPLLSMARAPELDGLLVGEPEDAVLALADLASFDEAASVPSLVYRKGGEVVPHRQRGVFTGFQSMPHPAWDLLRLDRYRLPAHGLPYVLVETSRGCPHSCDFCIAYDYNGHNFRERDAKAIVDEVEAGKRQFGVNCFYFWGDTVTLNIKTFTQLCDELIARNLGIVWLGNARADNLVKPEFVARVKQSGCWMLALGIESESDDTRRDMMKRLERQKIKTAIDNMRNAGIKSFGFFIFGYPGDTPESIARTAAYARELDVDFLNFYPAVPYPGTALYDRCVREGLLTDDSWSRLDYSSYVLQGNGLDEATVMNAIRSATRQYYLRPRWLAHHVRDAFSLLKSSGPLVLRSLVKMFSPVGRSERGRDEAPGRGHAAVPREPAGRRLPVVPPAHSDTRRSDM